MKRFEILHQILIHF